MIQDCMQNYIRRFLFFPAFTARYFALVVFLSGFVCVTFFHVAHSCAQLQIPIQEQLLADSETLSGKTMATRGAFDTAFDTDDPPKIKTESYNLVSTLTDTAIPVVNVRQSSTIVSHIIRLGDIADCLGSDFMVQELSDIPIGYAPKPGKVKVLRDRWLTAKIHAIQWIPQNLQLIIPTKFYVRRASQEISREELREFFEDQVQAALSWDDYQINNFSVRGVKVYPAGDLTLSLQANSTQKPMGRVSFRVDVRIDGKEYDTISLSGQVDVFDQVVHAAGSLRRGTVLTLRDLFVKRSNISNIHGGYLEDPKYAVGLALRTGVSRNKVIEQDMLEKPPLVRSGDIVSMIINKGNLSIHASGIAMGDGRLKEHIRVENISSGKKVHGLVSDQGEVTVIY